jgi:aspartyl-tRNA(Asn)/glutamyl-tRNA(Gln) amidotransferase subunit A
MNPTDLTITEAAPLLRERKLSPVELTEAYLERIERLNPILNAYITVTAEQAMDAARVAEAEIMRGIYRGVLHGIPIALKDNFITAGIRTTAGSSFLRDYVPQEDNSFAKRPRDGAILLGKTNMHEWAFGVINKNPFYGDTRNPWDTARITGGSSGGSAAAVAARLCAGAFGTDTRGSVRIPASICGVVGLKPHKRAMLKDDLIPLSHVLDHVGVMGRTVNDAMELVYSYQRVGRGVLNEVVSPSKCLIFVGNDPFTNDLSPEIAAAFATALDVFRSLGASIVEVDLGFLREVWEASRIISSCDAAAYHHQRLQENPDGFGADVLPRLREGQGYSGVQYSDALRTGEKMDSWLWSFLGRKEKFALMAIPTLPIPTPRHDDDAGIAEARLRYSSFNAPFNFANRTSISLPCGFDSNDMPIGLQLVVATEFLSHERGIYDMARAYEQATEWHKRQPPLDG